LTLFSLLSFVATMVATIILWLIVNWIYLSTVDLFYSILFYSIIQDVLSYSHALNLIAWMIE
jgi:hypothetical protein